MGVAGARRCTKCGREPAPTYHEWCGGCYGAWRAERLRRRKAADPKLDLWRRTWQRLRMRAYRGHEMVEEACRTCGRRPANLLLLSMEPLRWTWLCRADKERLYPNRTWEGRPKRPRPTEARILAEARTLGL